MVPRSDAICVVKDGVYSNNERVRGVYRLEDSVMGRDLFCMGMWPGDPPEPLSRSSRSRFSAAERV